MDTQATIMSVVLVVFGIALIVASAADWLHLRQWRDAQDKERTQREASLRTTAQNQAPPNRESMSED